MPDVDHAGSDADTSQSGKAEDRSDLSI
jgi:hypothetical protein